LSLGGPFDPIVFDCGHSPICRELRRLWRQGIVICIAAGNEGRLVIEVVDGMKELNLKLSLGGPDNLEEAIAVGSVHKESPHLYDISYFSSRGPTADGRAKPDVVAPGEKILSCMLIRVFERLKYDRGLETLRVDNGPEFLSADFVAWAEQAGMAKPLHPACSAKSKRLKRLFNSTCPRSF
jgi:hypothetical protein